MLNNFYLEYVRQNIVPHIIFSILQIYIPLEKIALPHYYGKLISNLKSGNLINIKRLFFYLLSIWIIIQVLNIAKTYVYSIIFPKFIGFIRLKLIDRVIDSYKNNYEDLKTGQLLTKIIESPYTFYGMAKETKNLLMNNTITYISTFCYLYYYSKFISLIYAISIVVVLYITYVYVASCKGFVKESENTYVEAHEQVDDSMNNLISVYTSNQVKNEKQRLEKYSDISVKAEKKLINYNTSYRSYYSLAFIIIFIVLNYFTFKIYLDKKIKLEVLVSIVIITYTILTGFMSIFYDVKDFMDNKERLDVLDEYLDKMPPIIKNTRKNNFNTPQVFKDLFVKIEIKNLTFQYQNSTIFEKFNLTIEPKQKIGLVGNIGSGKSTLVKLIIGLQSVYTGKILINGIDIKRLNIDKLRNYISYIPQHPKLFNRTLYENIIYGLAINGNQISEKKIYEVLNSAGLNDITKKFKLIMHQEVGKNGSKLSGGQRQIVWLLRSLLKDNRMIILDEPTSSLDQDNKQKVISLIEELSKKRNIILITHDNSVLKNMDRIIKLDKGKIIEDTYLHR